MVLMLCDRAFVSVLSCMSAVEGLSGEGKSVGALRLCCMRAASQSGWTNDKHHIACSRRGLRLQ